MLGLSSKNSNITNKAITPISQVANGRSNISSVNSLNKEKEALERQLLDLESNVADKRIKDSDIKKSQKTRIKSIQNQLTEIDQKIEQGQLEDIKNSKIKNSRHRDKNDSQRMNSRVLSVNDGLKKLKKQYAVKKSMLNQSKRLRSEIKMNKARGKNTNAKEKRLDNLKEGLSKVKYTISQTIKNTTNKIPRQNRQKYLEKVNQELKKMDKKNSKMSQGLVGNIIDKKM